MLLQLILFIGECYFFHVTLFQLEVLEEEFEYYAVTTWSLNYGTLG